MEVQKGKILNEIDDKTKYKETYPEMKGKGEFKALHELHVFLMPVNPEQKDVDLAIEATKKYNEKYAKELGDYTMKMCYLTLLFRKAGPVKVLQSARYLRSDDTDEVIKEIYKDAEFYQDYGFDIARIKIEANAWSIKGVPESDEDAKKFPKYFEHHIKVEHKTCKENKPLPKDEEDALTEVSQKMCKLYKAPVPLSWNNLANPDNHENPGYQRFLNIRFRNQGMKSIQSAVENIRKSINEQTNFKVVKSIDEYVWYDTYTSMDWGWIDFSPEDEKELISS
mmetsp:Transcript_24222/g.21331  ORF Transcript_24222/g.21331 Transcript_24222/m.21331 type:complete len:281 (+) Transcript_24222:79-921(+)|eukprot:CAMPEP_0114587790 /NCGR_PEP_ID=MMETSP0125-20121206/10663_1 /TAXON_ID=485358 ORGANISM="Aristerostoma sp., Strain ATCC 50986" /NCGR_SAMPLE_ID=MMETSP0125 /ASSEMBLY_ACC=CAM_ASM_000245 /LENGTH=280 /DNA_ID=CAMNT_0001783879 /DNA_START=69 /DNA_END=911 /DNA_ORIENTATION=+